MLKYLLTSLRSRPLRTSVLTFCATLLLLVAGVSLVREVRLQVFIQQLEGYSARYTSENPVVPTSWSFRFQDTTCTVSVMVPRSAISNAGELATDEVFSSRGIWRQRYLQALVSAEAEGPIVAAMADSLRETRDRLGLDSDEYLELLVRSVQVIPYGTPEPEVLLPSEVLVGMRGVCSEKTVLLGALLVHEGYDTVAWVFDAEHHVGLGIASDTPGFRESGYSYIETTLEAYVGQVEPRYAGISKTKVMPVMVPLGGETAFTSAYQTEFILRRLEHAERSKVWAADYHRYAAQTSGPWQERYAQRAEVHSAAIEIAEYIIGNCHDRGEVFRSLAYSNEGVVDGESIRVKELRLR